jgi:hypothetical protein
MNEVVSVVPDKDTSRCVVTVKSDEPSVEILVVVNKEEPSTAQHHLVQRPKVQGAHVWTKTGGFDGMVGRDEISVYLNGKLAGTF